MSPSPAPRSSRRWSPSDLGGLLPAVAFVLLFALLPLLALLGAALLYAGSSGGPLSLLLGPGTGAITRAVLGNSLEQGGASAALCLAWGYPVGVFLGRGRFRGRDLALALLLVPFLLPVLVVVLGVQELFGTGGVLSTPWPGLGVLGSGLPGILTVNVFYNTPVVALFTVAGVESSSPRLEEAVAMLGGGPWRVFRDVWARPSLLGAAAGTLLAFLFSFLSFAPPYLLGGGYRNFTVEDWIYILFRPLGGLGGSSGAAALLSIWVIVLLALPSLVYLLLVRQVRTLGLSGGRPRLRGRLRWNDFRAWAYAAPTAALFGFVGLVLGTIVLRSWTLPQGGWGAADWTSLFSTQTASALQISTAGAIANSLFFAAATLGAVLLLGVATGFARLRHPLAGGAVDLLSFVPLLLSPVILAFGMYTLYQGSLETDTWAWVLVLGSQVALALPFGLQTLSLAVRSNPPAAREAATTLGATRWRAYLDADVPSARPAVLSAALFAFAISLGEFTSTNILYEPPYTTLPVELYLLEGLRGSSALGSSWALGALLVLLSLLSFLVILGVGRRVRL